MRDTGKRTPKAVLVTTEVPIQTGGIGTFIWNFAKLLRGLGHDVHIIMANPTSKPVKEWIDPFKQLGITVSYAFASPITVPDGYSWHKKVSEVVSGLIPADADVVYLADWQAKGIDFVRGRRYRADQLPVVVTVLHGCTKWLREGQKELPYSEEQLWLDFGESYVGRHSDFVVAPGQYMLDWVRGAGWKLPTDERVRVLALPFYPTSARVPAIAEAEQVAAAAAAPIGIHDAATAPGGAALALRSSVPVHTMDDSTTTATAPGATCRRFKRLVFFGRLETRKGIELFVNGLARLQGKPCLRGIEEIILLGGASKNSFGGTEEVIAALQKEVGAGVTVEAKSKLNTFEAQAYLAANTSDTLVVVPSLRENFPLAVIETSLIPDLNLICSNTGSISEILGPRGQRQLFEPFVASFAAKLEETLLAGPRPDVELGKYDWQRANEGWASFHLEACQYAELRRAELAIEQRAEEARRQTAPAPLVGRQSADVCISYYNLAPYLPYMLESLTRQTTDDFNVIVIDDGSPDPEARETFERLSRQYTPRGWQFLTTPNGGLSAARNAGAAAGDADHLIFLDADDVAAPHLIERFTQGIRRTRDDCLTCYFALFRGEGWHPSYAQGSFYQYTPAGSDPLLGVVSNPFGGAGCIVHRDAFNDVGGFTTDVSKFVGFEDYEFYARLALSGHALDVIPDYLLYYRIRDDGMFRTNDLYENKMRVLRVYEERLRQVGLEGLASFAAGAYARAESGTSPEAPQYNEIWYLINHVSGHAVAKALRLKLRNQVARRFGLPLKYGD